MSTPKHHRLPAFNGPSQALPPDATPEDGPSKSQRKREMLELQRLGERLLTLPAHKIAALALPESLADALHLARRITAHEGRRRQLQYIGKLMRGLDATAIRAAIEGDDSLHRAETARMHRAERWRELLITHPERLAEFVSQHPAAATAGLHTLIRSARAEAARAQHGRYYRELYRVVRTVMAADDLATADTDLHLIPGAVSNEQSE
jgi:ribosome-associated protein